MIVIASISLSSLPSAAVAFSNAQFGEGSDPIALKDVQCDGNGDMLLECYSDPLLAATGCSHAEDAGVRCEGSFHCPPLNTIISG